MKDKIITPKYFNKFKCMQGLCPNTCCKDWTISIDKETMQKYKNLDDKNFSNFLLDNISANNTVRLCKKVCPFLDDNCLCSIQKKYDESFLSDICRTFPRSILKNKQYIKKELDLSCPATFNLIKKYHNQSKYLKMLTKLNIDTKTKQIITKLKNIEIFAFKNTKKICKNLFVFLKKKYLKKDFKTFSFLDIKINTKTNFIVPFYAKLEQLFNLLNFKNPVIRHVKTLNFFSNFNKLSNDNQKELLQTLKDFTQLQKKNLYTIFNYYLNYYTFENLSTEKLIKSIQKSIVLFYLLKMVMFKYFLTDKLYFKQNFLTIISSFSKAVEHTDAIYTIEKNLETFLNIK